MNKLDTKARVQILNLLCEGMSMRAVARVVDVSFNTVAKALIDAGTVCAEMHDELVRDVNAKRVQCDEIWAFNYCKERNRATAKAAPADAGDIWTWTGIDADSKLIVSYLVGDRSGQAAIELMDDLRSRLANRVQITTDGDPDPKHVSTSYVEAHNKTMRMHMRRFTRLTNGHSKKVANHVHMVALYTLFYNFIRTHGKLRMTPAMAAGIATTFLSFEDVISRIDAAHAPKVRGPYKKRAAA